MILYGTCVPVAVRLVANCYAPFTFIITEAQLIMISKQPNEQMKTMLDNCY